MTPEETQQQNSAQPVLQDQSVFKGPITPQDATYLLEFINRNITIPTVTYIYGRSHGTSDTSIAGSFTPEKVAYNSNDFASGITWDGSSNRFKALTAGKYLVTASVGYNGT